MDERNAWPHVAPLSAKRVYDRLWRDGAVTTKSTCKINKGKPHNVLK